MENFPQQLNELQTVLKDWNSTAFGNIFAQKMDFFTKLKRIDRKIQSGWSNNLIQLQKAIWKEYEEILAKEEILWYQKSRAKRIEFGDRNTMFFHGVTTITKLQNNQGVWIDDPIELERVATEYFKDLFFINEPSIPYILEGHFPALDSISLGDLDRNINDEEIHRTVKNIGAFKAPGPDGYQAIFYHSQWKLIGLSFCKMIMDIWENLEKLKISMLLS